MRIGKRASSINVGLQYQRFVKGKPVCRAASSNALPRVEQTRWLGASRLGAFDSGQYAFTPYAGTHCWLRLRRAQESKMYIRSTTRFTAERQQSASATSRRRQ